MITHLTFRPAATAARRRGASVSAAASAAPQLRVMIAGPPAAGKGTQCAKIVDKVGERDEGQFESGSEFSLPDGARPFSPFSFSSQFGLVHISAGDLLRAEVAAGTPNGVTAKRHMDAGELVPNSVVVGMVTTRLAAPDAAAGWLLDGYPRSAEQADAIEAAGVRPDVFILVECPDDVLVERVTGRRLDPVTGAIYHVKFAPPPADPDVVARLVQRSDDTEDALRARLASHHANVAAVVGYYEDVLVTVDGTGLVDDVFATIDRALSAARDARVQAEAAAA